MKINVSKIKKIGRLFTIVFALLFFSAIFFLYRYFYQTLTHAQVVVLLKTQVSPEMLNTKVWNKVIENVDYKKSTLVDKNNLAANPFKNIELLPEVDEDAED